MRGLEGWRGGGVGPETCPPFISFRRIFVRRQMNRGSEHRCERWPWFSFPRRSRRPYTSRLARLDQSHTPFQTDLLVAFHVPWISRMRRGPCYQLQELPDFPLRRAGGGGQSATHICHFCVYSPSSLVESMHLVWSIWRSRPHGPPTLHSVFHPVASNGGDPTPRGLTVSLPLTSFFLAPPDYPVLFNHNFFTGHPDHNPRIFNPRLSKILKQRSVNVFGT